MIFYGNYEIQPILFLVTIIFVIMLTAYHFGNILDLNSYFFENINGYEQILHDVNYNHDYVQYIH